MMRSSVLLLFFLGTSLLTTAQDTLPDFSAISRGNRIFLSWKNQYPEIRQINIQRSLDSTRNFTTIMAIPDPTIPENGFVDSKAPTNTMFYRFFILLDSGKYVFSRSRRPVPGADLPADGPTDGSNGNRIVLAEDLTVKERRALEEKLTESAPTPEKFFTILRNDSLINRVAEKNFKRFRDSVVRRTKDTLVFAAVDSIIIRPFVPKVVYKPSKFVYPEPDGNIAIALDDAPQKKYWIRFFDEKQKKLFDVRKIRENFLILDKTNFLHAGWYYFELYDDEKLVEKHRFFIPKD